MAGVVVEADAAFDEGGVAGKIAEALEEGEGFRGVFKMAERFGFESEVEVFAGLLGQIFDEMGAFFEVSKDFLLVAVEGFVGAGEGRD